MTTHVRSYTYCMSLAYSFIHTRNNKILLRSITSYWNTISVTRYSVSKLDKKHRDIKLYKLKLMT